MSRALVCCGENSISHSTLHGRPFASGTVDIDHWQERGEGHDWARWPAVGVVVSIDLNNQAGLGISDLHAVLLGRGNPERGFGPDPCQPVGIDVDFAGLD